MGRRSGDMVPREFGAMRRRERTRTAIGRDLPAAHRVRCLECYFPSVLAPWCRVENWRASWSFAQLDSVWRLLPHIATRRTYAGRTSSTAWSTDELPPSCCSPHSPDAPFRARTARRSDSSELLMARHSRNSNRRGFGRPERESTRLLHKSWHVIVTRTPTFRVANASQNSPCSIRPCHDCRPIASVAYPHRR